MAQDKPGVQTSEGLGSVVAALIPLGAAYEGAVTPDVAFMYTTIIICVYGLYRTVLKCMRVWKG